MYDGVTEPCQDGAVIVHNIAIVQSNYGRLAAGEHVSVGHPALAAFAVRPDLQTIFFQRAVEALHTRAIMPQPPSFVQKPPPPPLDFLELYRRCLGEGKNDLANVSCATEFAQDRVHRWLFEFGIERREHQGDGLLAGEIIQLALDHAEI